MKTNQMLQKCWLYCSIVSIFLSFTFKIASQNPAPINLSNPKPVISSISPLKGSPGSTVTVKGELLTNQVVIKHQQTNTQIDIVGTLVSTFEIKFKIPDQAICGVYSVFVKGIDITGKGNPKISNSKTFSITEGCSAPPQITTISPLNASAGSLVTIMGSNFQEGMKVVLRINNDLFTALNVIVDANIASSQTITFTLPGNIPCNDYRVFVKITTIGIASNEAGFRVDCPPNSNWQINLEKLWVGSQQESGGDEPYFVVIGFRSSFFVPNSTQVFWSGYLEDDWANGIKSGQTREIPEEMGVVRFPGVRLTPLNLGSQLELANEHSEILGAIIVSLESDWSSWGRIRDDKMNPLRDLTENKLKELIEDFELDINDPGGSFNAAFEEIKARVEGNLGDWFGSLGNPDDLFGYKVFFFTATTGFMEQSDQIRQMAEGPVQLKFHDGDTRYLVYASIKASN